VYPDTAAAVKEDTKRLGPGVGKLLRAWLAYLERGDVDPSQVRKYDAVYGVPRWRRVEFSENVIVIFRPLTDEEREVHPTDPAPYFLVARVIAPPEEPAALAALLAEAQAKEAKEEREEREAEQGDGHS
jgi:hypothetical protein